MPSDSVKKLKIAIVGGGVGGLICAIALAKQGVEADIYEAATKFGEIGAGIGLGGNSTTILKGLGLLDDIIALDDGQRPENPLGWIRFRRGLGDEHPLIYNHSIGIGHDMVGVHRASFLDALVKHFDLTRVHFSKRCIAVESSENDTYRYTMHFADGTSTEADIVIGADGLKSTVRAAVTGSESAKNLSFSNRVAYRALVPTSAVQAAGTKIDYTEAPINFLGKDKHVITYPIRSGTLINIVAFVTNREVPMGQAPLSPGEPQVVAATTQELVDQYADFGEDVRKVLGCVQKPDRWNIFVVYPLLDSYVKGRIALLGDAAHAMLPHLGAGAGQGLEDADLLAKLIGHPETNAENLEEVLKVYDEVRRPHSQHVWNGSARAGDIYENAAEYGFSPQEMREELVHWWHEVVGNHTLERDSGIAVQRLQELGIFTA